MDQIYYTQCPMGYGCGISNGFQVKRISKFYPPDADFRLFAFRPYPAGGRTLAPETLRYRREGDVAEVACLTPRTLEYETERGLWGRPGGLFVHSVRLGAGEQAGLRNWYAGLAGASVWTRRDVQPSRQVGMEPPDLLIGPADFRLPPSFATVAPLAEGLEPGFLAKILAALAEAARTGGTVFLIDTPEKLAERIGLLTFAFPGSLREDLTFSTFHDRPEELPWFRLQGTSSFARPNRAALTALGRIVDMTARTCEPDVEAPPWSERLAGWLARRSPEDTAAWEAVDAVELDGADRWDEAELDALFTHHSDILNGPDRPASPEDWRRLAYRAAWVGRRGMAKDWAPKVGPDWWREQPVAELAESREALAAVLASPEAWETPRAEDWGGIAAKLWARAAAEERDAGLMSLVEGCPYERRAGFLRTLVGRLPEPASLGVLRSLRGRSTDPGLLLPLEAPAAYRTYRDGGNSEPIGRVLTSAMKTKGTVAAVLDALAAEARADGRVPWLAAALDQLFLRNPEALAWALKLGDEARAWLEPGLRARLFSGDADRPSWRALRDKARPEDRSTLCRIFLNAAAEPGGSTEAFRWGVEEFLLGYPADVRPADPRWGSLYLARIESDLEVFDRIVRPKPENEPVRAWLAGCPLDSAGRNRLERLRTLLQALKSGKASMIRACDFAPVHERDRPRLLGLLLERTTDDPRSVLEALRDAWPELSEVGDPRRPSFAAEFAAWRWISERADTPTLWLDHVRWIVDALGNEPDEAGPTGWCALILAATSRRARAEGREPPWGLRQWVFDEPSLARAVAADLREDLEANSIGEANNIVRNWDSVITRSSQALVVTFWEIILNACDGARLVDVGATYVTEFKKFKHLSWWEGVAKREGIPEMREGFVRTIPMTPLSKGELGKLTPWLSGSALNENPSSSDHDPLPAEPVAEGKSKPFLSKAGSNRWKCVQRLTNFVKHPEMTLADWGQRIDRPPLGSVSIDDRMEFLERMLEALPESFKENKDERYRLAELMKSLGFESAPLLRKIGRDGNHVARLVAGCIKSLLQEGVDAARREYDESIRRMNEIRSRIARLERKLAEPLGSADAMDINSQLECARLEFAEIESVVNKSAIRLDAAGKWLTADQDAAAL